jgi:cysteine desulfurase
MRIYLDNAATTAMSPEVIEVMTDLMKNHYGNPSSIHQEGRTMRAKIEEARKTIANQLKASIGEIFFTSGGTEANNMAIKCSVRDLGVKRIITSKIEHHCVLHTVESIHNHQNITVDYVKLDSKGRVNYKHLEELLKSSEEKTLVTLMHANNEIGTMIDIEAVGEVCAENGAYFHSDTVQTAGHFPIDVSTTKIHFMSGSSHKFHGPKGVGFIYINGDAMLKPFIDGGAQERNMRGGTENAYGIIGMAKAFEMACTEMEARHTYISGIRQYMMNALLENFEGIEFNGDYDKNCLYTVLSTAFKMTPRSEMMLMSLDIYGISASGGSACSSGAEQGSHVLAGINASEAFKTIRFSFSHYNTKEEIDIVIEKLKSIVPEQVKQLVMEN